jgi:hypothetical protein
MPVTRNLTEPQYTSHNLPVYQDHKTIQGTKSQIKKPSLNKTAQGMKATDQSHKAQNGTTGHSSRNSQRRQSPKVRGFGLPILKRKSHSQTRPCPLSFLSFLRSHYLSQYSRTFKLFLGFIEISKSNRSDRERKREWSGSLKGTRERGVYLN